MFKMQAVKLYAPTNSCTHDCHDNHGTRHASQKASVKAPLAPSLVALQQQASERLAVLCHVLSILDVGCEPVAGACDWC